MEEKDNDDVCQECGALRVDGMDCRAQLDAVLYWEWQDLALMAQHFLTILSYNIQHPASFSEASVDAMQALFIEHLDNDASLDELRQRMSSMFDGNIRVLKPDVERQPMLRSWHMTIADVYIPNKPEDAAERVKAWAASIREQIDGV